MHESDAGRADRRRFAVPDGFADCPRGGAGTRPPFADGGAARAAPVLRTRKKEVRMYKYDSE